MGRTILQSQIERARTQFRTLPSRQQRAIRLAAVLGALLLAFWGLLKPAWNYSHRARAALDDERALSALMQQHADSIRQLNAARQAKTGQDTSLFALASKTAGDHQLTLQRYEPGTDGKLAVWLTDTEFNTLLAWLDQLVQQYDVQIEHLTVGQSEQPGRVEVQVVLRQ